MTDCCDCVDIPEYAIDQLARTESGNHRCGRKFTRHYYVFDCSRVAIFFIIEQSRQINCYLFNTFTYPTKSLPQTATRHRKRISLRELPPVTANLSHTVGIMIEIRQSVRPIRNILHRGRQRLILVDSPINKIVDRANKDRLVFMHEGPPRSHTLGRELQRV